MRAFAQRNQIFAQVAVPLGLIGKTATLHQAHHSLVGVVEQDAQEMDLISQGVPLHSLPQAAPNPLALELVFNQNAGLGGWLLPVRFAHVVGQTHDDFAVLLGGRYKARTPLWSNTSDLLNLRHCGNT